MISDGQLMTRYARIRDAVLAAGYLREIEWQRSRSFCSVTESEFLCEAAWVVLCAGFRTSEVERRFAYLSLCFCDWESAHAIVERREACRSTALAGFRNVRKIDAILRIASLVDELGFVAFKGALAANPFAELQQLPFIGPVTGRHLAKNLGLGVAKPDRHLMRLANLWGYPDVDSLCARIAGLASEAIQCVDIVLWRYAERFGLTGVD